MNAPARLYERAAAGDKANALLHIGAISCFWVGAQGHLTSHNGAAPVLLAGLYGKFRLRLQGQAWMYCPAAVISPGVWHELDFSGVPFVALYAEPSRDGVAALAPLLQFSTPAPGVLIGESGTIPLLRDLYEDLRSETWVEQALEDLLGFARRRTAVDSLDRRVAKVIDLIESEEPGARTARELAQSVGLSSSRFQHLFTQQAGVPFRRYRAWRRLRRAWLEIAKGATVTQAAHAAGFFDSAHLAHEWRRTFGSVPSNGLRRNYRVSGLEG
jgi:AraC-like DNA-binding protein